jgi:hypothetical protein
MAIMMPDASSHELHVTTKQTHYTATFFLALDNGLTSTLQ